MLSRARLSAVKLSGKETSSSWAPWVTFPEMLGVVTVFEQSCHFSVLTSKVLGKLLTLSSPQFKDSSKGGNNTNFTGLFRALNELIRIVSGSKHSWCVTSIGNCSNSSYGSRLFQVMWLVYTLILPSECALFYFFNSIFYLEGREGEMSMYVCMYVSSICWLTS